MPERSPIHEQTSNAGAVFIDETGWLMPDHFGNPEGEYQTARDRAAVFDLSHRSRIVATGPDTAGFLHNLCTNDVKALQVDQACEAFFTTGQAKIVVHAIIEHFLLPDGKDAFWLDLAPGTVTKALQHLNYYLITEQVELGDRTRDYAQFYLAGPQGKAILQQALSGDIPELNDLQSVTKAHRIRRNNALGVPGYDLICDRNQAASFWQSITGAGAAYAGLKAYHMLRIEAGMPFYGLDIDETNLPQEVGRIERTVSFTKGCYIGQETVARIRTYGHVNRSLVGLKLAKKTSAPKGCLLFRDGKEVGQTLSSVLSPKLGTAVALAYVRRGNQEPGTMLEIDMEGSRGSAEVVSLPFGGLGEGGR